MKNEEAKIGACLDSIANVADEVVVLDTGSTDGTLDVVRGHKHVRLLRSKKFKKDTPQAEFHFAEARNEVLDKCHGKWILSIDADELLHEPGDLRQWLETSEAPSAEIALYKGDTRTAWVPRIFQRALHRWSGRYHDVPCPWRLKEATRVPEEVGIFRNLRLGVEHFSERNITLLTREVLDNPNLYADPKAIMLADEHRALGDAHIPTALAIYMAVGKAREGRLGPFESYIAFAIGDCWSKMGLDQEAMSWFLSILSQRPNHGWAMIALGDCCARLKNWKLAAMWYGCASKVEAPEQLNPCVEIEYPRDRIERELALVLRKIGESDPAFVNGVANGAVKVSS